MDATGAVFDFKLLCARADEIGVDYRDLLGRGDGHDVVKEIKRRLSMRRGQLDAIQRQPRPAEHLFQQEYAKKYNEFINLRAELGINGEHGLPPASGLTAEHVAMINSLVDGLRRVKARRSLSPLQLQFQEIHDCIKDMNRSMADLDSRLAALEAVRRIPETASGTETGS